MNHHSLRSSIHQIGDDYDFSLPRYFVYAAISGGILLAIASISYAIGNTEFLAPLLIVAGLLILPTIVQMIAVALLRQFRMNIRSRIANSVNWRGDEMVLDIGTGSGITLFGCAKYLKTGKGIGIDIYEPNSGGGNAQRFWKNAKQEGVESRVELQNVDARHMPFEDASFDVIVSTFAFHHIGDHEGENGQIQAAREIARVLKPNGKVLVNDVANALGALETTLKDAGFTVRKEGKNIPLFIAQKPS